MGGLAIEALSADGGADQGVDVGAPERAKAVGDLAEDNARAQRLFEGGVGGWHGAIDKEGEELSPPTFGLAPHLRLDARRYFR